METNRWWSSCRIVFATVMLASCTQVQNKQPMPIKTQDTTSGPCPSGKWPMSTTSEFRVCVTEIQLINHDSGADVSLTFVNQTGRRLFLTTLQSYLTDSSGISWNVQRVTGLPSGWDHSVPLEPNIETQISVSFSRSGQAPSDLTFTLRGDISIMKVDSRGEPIPRQFAVTRGFNISGIRPMPPQPQSSGPAK
jgi:hypothetical protein